MSRFFPQKLRRLLPACVLSLFLHFLVLGGLAGMMTTWIKPETETKIINARLASNAPKETPIPVAIPASTPAPIPAEKPKKPEPPPQPPVPFPETPARLPEVSQIPEEQPLWEEDEYEIAAEHLMQDQPPEVALEGEDEGGDWPDIPGNLEAIEDEMENALLALNEAEFVEHVLPDRRIFPPKGAINYRVYRGEQAWEIGTARLEWELRQRVYRFVTAMKTVGLIGFLYQAQTETESMGIISSANGGFFPLRYQVRRDGHAHETTAFDWSQRNLYVEAGKRSGEFPLRRDSQDLLSLQGQFSFWIALEEAARKTEETTGTEMDSDAETNADADADANVNVNANATWQGWAKTIWMATGKGYEAYRIVAVGEEFLELSERIWPVLHFRVSEGRAETDFWLAKDLYWLPAQIRHRDRRGDVYEQRLERYDFVFEIRE
ncbi:MAG: DUF3108 domain-containing protein [Betaproteobacteria bacterium]|nr:DUF3108 domain-containing protein [Betaproteobacteria bacterium]